MTHKEPEMRPLQIYGNTVAFTQETLAKIDMRNMRVLDTSPIIRCLWCGKTFDFSSCIFDTWEAHKEICSRFKE